MSKAKGYWTLLICFLLEGVFGQSLQAVDIQAIQNRGSIRIGVKNNLPLMGFLAQDRTLKGYEIDLSKKLIQTIWGDRLKIEFVPLKNRDRLSAVVNEEVDLAIANLRRTDSRSRIVRFSQPYLKSSTTFIGRKPLQSNQNICSAKIGILQGSIALGRVISRCPNGNFIGLNSYQQAWDNLQKNDIDLFAGDVIALQGWQSNDLSISKDRLGLSSVAIAMPKGLQHQSLHEAIDLALETLEENGKLQQMRNIWGLSSE